MTTPRDQWDDFQEAPDNYQAIVAKIDKQGRRAKVDLYIIAAGLVIALIGIILGMVAD